MSRKELSTSFNTRQHMEKRDYELFYYSDVRLDRISSHRHGYYEVYFFLEGSVDFQAGGSTRRLQYGDFLLLPPGVSHRPSIDDPDTPYRRFVLWLDPDFCLQLTRISPDLMYGFQASAETGGFFYRSGRFPAREIQARFIDLLEETKAGRVFSSTNATLKIASLLMRLNQIAYDALHPASPSVDGAQKQITYHHRYRFGKCVPQFFSPHLHGVFLPFLLLFLSFPITIDRKTNH